jgi:hypothetical protein
MRLPLKLIQAIHNKDFVTVMKYRNAIVTNYGYPAWKHIYNSCKTPNIIEGYNFPELFSKVFIETADNIIVGDIEPQHNED